MKTVLHLIHSRLPTKMPAGTLSSPTCVTAARQQRNYELGSPAAATGEAPPRHETLTLTGTRLSRRAPHRAPASPPASPGPSSASPPSPPSSHTFPHLSRAEPDLQIISANKQKSGSMTMYFITLVSQIPPTG